MKDPNYRFWIRKRRRERRRNAQIEYFLSVGYTPDLIAKIIKQSSIYNIIKSVKTKDFDFKACSLCLKIKHLSEFPEESAGYLGRHSRCRSCVNKNKTKYNKKNTNKYKKWQQKSTKQAQEELRDWYVIQRLKKQGISISPETIALKREQLTLYRLIKEAKGTFKNGTN